MCLHPLNHFDGRRIARFRPGPAEPPHPVAASPYRVLARKYRPQTFHELIGQDAMVTTLANAIERDRIAHAFLLTGGGASARPRPRG